ncbi:hypothetical protein GEV33_001034 [Tenebrio molitor]|uniref:Uncharacterized protein n=1 Tax=Tenebrio molitor TaxID=7067 RepID=A0A8J6HWX8_TENMO|nr:hypothetical protein GEV33_001034 [Tenebrio molitor]
MSRWQKVFTHHPRSHRGRWFGEILSGHPAQTSSWCHHSGSTVCCSKLYGQIERFRRSLSAPLKVICPPKGSRQLPEGADLEADVVHEYVERLEMMVPFEGPRAAPSGQHEPSPAGGQRGDCGLRPMSGLQGKWQTTICLPIKRFGRLPNPTVSSVTGVAVRNLCVGLRREGSPST